MGVPVGRFAPSPTGPLHAGSLVAALASWLDARANGGRWLVRIEDVDTTRCSREHERTILAQLAALGLHADGPVERQTDRIERYAEALARLRDAGHTFECACSRRDIDLALRAAGTGRKPHAERVYPGTCRAGTRGRPVRSERLRVDRIASGRGAEASASADVVIEWTDRRLGPQQQNVTREVGDFVLRHADGRFTYQLAVVVDDADQGVTHVVRGEDLADNTARQIHLQRLLGLPLPSYLHTPLVRAADGQKLSKQTGAAALDTSRPIEALDAAARILDLDLDLAPDARDGREGTSSDGPPAGRRGDDAALERWLVRAIRAWRRRWGVAAVG
jgi:glutamyl-Q tRNA(Asp) synthetase